MVLLAISTCNQKYTLLDTFSMSHHPMELSYGLGINNNVTFNLSMWCIKSFGTASEIIHSHDTCV